MTSAVRAAVSGAEIQRTITPVDGSVYAERPLATSEEVAGALERARKAQAGWRRRAVEERAAAMSAFVDAFVARSATRSRPRSPGRWVARSATRRARCAASRSGRAT